MDGDDGRVIPNDTLCCFVYFIYAYKVIEAVLRRL
jgi:hypothetical protein